MSAPAPSNPAPADFAPGVMEALQAVHGDAAGPAAAATAPLFIDAAARSKSFPLVYPVTFEGREIRTIVLQRLTTTDVAAFTDRIASLDEKAQNDLYWPIYKLADGTPAPTALLDGLDADDMETLTKAAADFLPRRFRRAADGGSTPPSGASTAP